MNASEIRKARIVQSAVAHKIHSVRTSTLTSKCKPKQFRIEEICPYKSAETFWTIAGGAKVSKDLHTHEIFVRGGEWTTEIHNKSTTTPISVEMYLAFMYDGADYISLEGDSADSWHPNLAGQRFYDALKLSHWKRSIILEGNQCKKYKFKIGAFNIKVSEWFTQKKGWPYLYICHHSSNPLEEAQMNITMGYQITFTEGEDSRYALSRDEIEKYVKSVAMFTNQVSVPVPGVADTTMDESAQPSG